MSAAVNRRAGLWGQDRPTEPGHCRDDYDRREHDAGRLNPPDKGDTK